MPMRSATAVWMEVSGYHRDEAGRRFARRVMAS